LCRKLVSALEYRDRIAELEAKLEQTRQELTGMDGMGFMRQWRHWAET
jgi:hypothetical protein